MKSQTILILRDFSEILWLKTVGKMIINSIGCQKAN